MEFPDESPTPPSDAAFLCSLELEMGVGLSFPFTPYDPPALFRVHPQLGPTESSFVAEGRSSFPYTADAPPPAYCSPWNSILPADISPSGPTPVSGTSEPSAYAAWHVSGDNVVVTETQSILPHKQDDKIRAISPCLTVPSLTGGQAIPASPDLEHMVLWYHVWWNAVVVDGPRIFVPQTIYQPHSQGDKERYVSHATLHPPIIFLAQDSPEWGVPIPHLLHKQSVRLVEGSEPAFTSCGPSVGIRIHWPGYQPFHKQVPTRDYTHERRMISKEKLAKVVARSVKQFLDTMNEQVMQVGSDMRWRVGPLNVKVDDIVLVSLHHVSQGSWQPNLRLRRIVGPNEAAGPH